MRQRTTAKIHATIRAMRINALHIMTRTASFAHPLIEVVGAKTWRSFKVELAIVQVFYLVLALAHGKISRIWPVAEAMSQRQGATVKKRPCFSFTAYPQVWVTAEFPQKSQMQILRTMTIQLRE